MEAEILDFNAYVKKRDTSTLDNSIEKMYNRCEKLYDMKIKKEASFITVNRIHNAFMRFKNEYQKYHKFAMSKEKVDGYKPVLRRFYKFQLACLG